MLSNTSPSKVWMTRSWMTRPKDMKTSELFAHLANAGVKERAPFYAHEAYARKEEIFSIVRHESPLLTASCNALGSFYPWLRQEEREKALDSLIPSLDERQVSEVEQCVLPYVREPLLFADLVCVRNYSRGMNGLVPELQGLHSRDAFLALIGPDGLFKPRAVEEEFLMTYAALCPHISPHVDTALKYMNGQYIDRVVTGVTNMCLAHFGGNNNALVGSVKQFFPKELHGKIWKAYNKKEWASYRIF